MPRERSPNRDKAFEIYREHKGKITNREIANILNEDEKKVAVWKQRDKWNNKLNVVQHKNECCTTKQKNKTKSSKNTKRENSPNNNNMAIEIDELTERQRLFAEEFARVPIAYKAAIKAGYSPNGAFVEGSRLLTNDKVKAYINYLKQLKRESLLVGEEDIVDMHMRIAFSDITDFVEFGRERVPVLVKGMPVMKENPLTGENEPVTKLVNSVRIREDFEVDGSLISEVSSGKDGVKIKLYDKQKSLDWLTNYFTLNPMDKHKIEFDSEKLKLAAIKNKDNTVDIVKESNNRITALADLINNPAPDRQIQDFEKDE